MVLLALFVACSSLLHLARAEQYDWAEPQTYWSGWLKVHHWHAAEARIARRREGIQLLFYGDSITQCWRFGAHGYNSASIEVEHSKINSWVNNRTSVCIGALEVFEKHFGSKYNAKIFGISGDQTPHMMYRLLHGEGPEGLHTKVAVLLIGTNDLGYAMTMGVEHVKSIATTTADRVTQICDYLASYDVQVVLMALLPRGDRRGESIFSQPAVFSEPINLINARLKDYANDKPKVHYIDCGDGFLIKNGAEIDEKLMPDALHPSAEGFVVMAECLESKISHLMEHGQQRKQP